LASHSQSECRCVTIVWPSAACAGRCSRLENPTVTTANARIMRLLFAAGLLTLLPLSGVAQDRLKTMPGYEQYQRMSQEIPSSVKLAAISVTWKDGGQAFEYRHDGNVHRYDIAAGKATVIGEAKEPPEGRGFFGRGRRGGGEGKDKAEGRGGVPR